MLKPFPSLPPITPTDAPILRNLLARDLNALRQFRDLFSAVVEIRENEEALLAPLHSAHAAAESEHVAEASVECMQRPVEQLPNESTRGAARRRPMRPPRPGTVRALVYEVLSQKSGVPQRRAEIVRAVAERKGASVASCEQPVATVLRDRFDPHLSRTNYGYYAFVSNQDSPAGEA